jgi:hypothetical protein
MTTPTEKIQEDLVFNCSCDFLVAVGNKVLFVLGYAHHLVFSAVAADPRVTPRPSIAHLQACDKKS